MKVIESPNECSYREKPFEWECRHPNATIRQNCEGFNKDCPLPDPPKISVRIFQCEDTGTIGADLLGFNNMNVSAFGDNETEAMMKLGEAIRLAFMVELEDEGYPMSEIPTKHDKRIADAAREFNKIYKLNKDNPVGSMVALSVFLTEIEQEKADV